jgi:hypothetical protein
VLEALERAELVVILRGSKRRESTCLVKCPTREQCDGHDEEGHTPAPVKRVAEPQAKQTDRSRTNERAKKHNSQLPMPNMGGAVAKEPIVWQDDRQDDRHNEGGETPEDAECEAKREALTVAPSTRGEITSEIVPPSEEDPPDRRATEEPGPEVSPPEPDTTTTIIDLQRQAANKAAIEQRRIDYAEVIRVWNEEIVPGCAARGLTLRSHPRLSPHSGIGRILAQRLAQEGLVSVLTVVRWFSTSPHERATFLREKGMGLDTLLSAKNFGKYLDFAKSPVTTPRGRTLDEAMGFPSEPRKPMQLTPLEQAIEDGDLDAVAELCGDGYLAPERKNTFSRAY